MEHFIDMRHVTERYAHRTPKVPDMPPDEAIMKLVSRKKRHLYNSQEAAFTYMVFYKPFASSLSTILPPNGHIPVSLGDTLSGFLFEGYVPKKIAISILRGRTTKTVEIPTFGEQVVFLDIPLFMIASLYTPVRVYFDRPTTCRVLYDFLQSSTRRQLMETYTSFHDGFSIKSGDGVLRLRYHVRPLRNIVQDTIREAGIHVSYPLLMQRSNRDAKALAAKVTNSKCLVFEP